MNAEQPTREVTEALASIEMQRQGKEKQLGVPASCGWALRELYGLFGRGTRTPEPPVEDTARRANVAAATVAIERLRRLAETGQRAMLKGRGAAAKIWRDAQSSGTDRER